MNKLKVVNIEVSNDGIETVTFENNKSKQIRQSFRVDNNDYQHKNSFGGLYRDIIEYIDTGNIEIRKEQNDISEMFQKLLQMRLFIDNGVVDKIDYDKYFNMDTDDSFFQKIREIRQSTNEYSIKNYLGIHSWEVGIGYPEWDKTSKWNFEYNEYGFTVRKGTSQPYSSIRIYNETLASSSFNVSPKYQNFYQHNSLICRTKYLNPDISSITMSSNNPLYSNYSLRKPVQVFFVVPTQYYLNESTIITDTVEILTKLKTGEFVPERVIEWLPYTQKNSELNFPNDYTDYIVPEFIMVQQIFEPYEQNFEWREFGILQGFNLTQQGLTLEKSQEEPNVSLEHYRTVTGKGDTMKELEQIFYPHGTMIDYKVHQVLRKNRNMRITRQIIFGIMNITSTLYQ